MESASPKWTGLESEASWLLRARMIAAEAPAEEDRRKTLGAVGEIVRLKLSLTPPGVIRFMVVVPSRLGKCALTWPPETKRTGMDAPLTCMQLSAIASDEV